jgi:hypothetical protein
MPADPLASPEESEVDGDGDGEDRAERVDGTKKGILRKRRSSLIAESLALEDHHDERLAVDPARGCTPVSVGVARAGALGNSHL